MKDLCYECEIDCKLEYCCGSHPETGESIPLTLNNGNQIMACPNLDSDGCCAVYNSSSMPGACREYLCHKFNETPLTELLL